MASVISATQLLTSGSSAAGSSFTTASVSVSGNKVVLIGIGGDNGGTAIPTCTISGLNATWTQVGTITDSGGTRRMTLFRAYFVTAQAGTITITWGASVGGGVNWSITQFDVVDFGGTNGANSIVQNITGTINAATAFTLTLSAFSSSNNGTYGVMFANGAAALSPGSGFTTLGIDNTSSGRAISAEFRTDNSTSVGWTWTGSEIAVGIACELKYLLSQQASLFFSYI